MNTSPEVNIMKRIIIAGVHVAVKYLCYDNQVSEDIITNITERNLKDEQDHKN